MFTFTTALLLLLLGFGVGVFGTLVGAGGGFVLTPVLLVLYPHESPARITAISLVVVFLNALSGSSAYARQRRIDYGSGLAFAAAALPGSIGGALVVRLAPVRLFDVLMGATLATLAVWLTQGSHGVTSSRPSGKRSERVLTDRVGRQHRYRVPVRRGVIYSVGVGFISSFLGIGGGVIHVPLMVGALGFPTHIATATSHFVLTFMAAAGSITHAIAGTFNDGVGLRRAAALSVGVIGGAQLGAHLSQRASGPLIRRLLALGLVALAIRLILVGTGAA
ncbi:MAG: sulfite exporter TauE/SafE family protein [Solirubrobacteraceae bacterium]|nr:MAG: sulfite exporter TauE/SafE family protein [Solirubrobacterales bacterium]